MQNASAEEALCALKEKGAVTFDACSELLDALQVSCDVEHHVSHGYSGRLVYHFSVSPEVNTIVRQHKSWSLLKQYLGCEPNIVRVQRIECVSNVTRTQLIHRDHDLGPRVMVALAVSDSNLNTVIFASNAGDEPKIRKHKYTRLASTCGIFDTYFFHRGAACKTPSRYRYFIHICATGLSNDQLSALREQVT